MVCAISCAAHVFSESRDLPPSASNHTLCATGSAESLPKYSRLAAESRVKLEKDTPITVTTKRAKFINPFDPTKVHGELAAFHRRWIHTFPCRKSGLAFQTHHSSFKSDNEEEEELDSLSNLSFPGSLSLRSSTVGSFGGHPPMSESREEFRSLRQVGGRSHATSGGSSETVALSGSEESGVRGKGAKVVGGDTAKTLVGKMEKFHSHSGSKSNPKSGSKSSLVRATPPTLNRSLTHDSIGTNRRMSDTSSKVVEDFTSIRRTGVDWQSLTEPACLPVTVDFFPSKEKLEQDYYVFPSELAVSSHNSYGSEKFSSISSR